MKMVHQKIKYNTADEDGNNSGRQSYDIHRKQLTVKSAALTVITLKVNRLNSPVKGQRLAEQMKKHDLTIYAVYKRLQIQRHKWVQCERMEKDILCK